MSYSVTTIVSPAVEPVDIDYIKLVARIDINDEDEFLESNIVAARALIEPHLGISLITQTNRMILDCFPWKGRHANQIQLPRWPVQSVESVNYVDSDGNAQVLDSSVYGETLIGKPSAIFLLSGQSWPATRVQPSAVWIDFVSGYVAADPDDLPDIVRPIQFWISACGALADDIRELDIFSIQPVSHLGGMRVIMKQKFHPAQAIYY